MRTNWGKVCPTRSVVCGCATDVISCSHILISQQMKDNPWLWSAGDKQGGAGAKSCEGSILQTFIPLFKHILPYLRFHVLLLLLLPARSSSSSLLLTGFPSRLSELKHLSGLSWVVAAHLYSPETRGMVWGGGGSSLPSLDLVSSKRLRQGGSAATTCDLCRCSCRQKLSHFESSGVEDTATFPSPLQEEFLSTFLCFVFFAGCGLLIAERYSWKRVSIFLFNLCPELLRSYCCFLVLWVWGELGSSHHFICYMGSYGL